MIFGMEAKKKLISWISLALYFLRLDSLLFLIIYPYKLIILTFINPPLIWLCALGSHFGVKMIISSFTPQVMVGWNISWESSVPLKPISLFLRVNKEGLCDGTKIWEELELLNLILMIFGMEEKDILKPKMVNFTPIWDPSAPKDVKGGLIKVSIINL